MISKLRSRLLGNRGVGLGALTALCARAAGVATSLIAMPIALEHLGTGRFGVFLMLYGVVSWLAVGNFGVHSSLGKMIANNDLSDGEVRHLLGAAFTYGIIAVGLTVTLVTIAFLLWSKSNYPGLGVSLDELRRAGILMIIIFAFQTILQVFEGVQIGQLKAYITYLLRIVGSIFTFAALLILPRYWNAIETFVIALTGGTLLSAALNAIVVTRRFPPKFSKLRQNLPTMYVVAKSGLSFAAIACASILQTHVPVFIIAMISGPGSAVDFGLFVRLLFVQMTVAALVTGPLWPAIMKAEAEHDHAWTKSAVRRAGILIIGGGALSFLMLTIFGSQILQLWLGRPFEKSSATQALFGLYFFQMAWSHYWAIVLIGYNREKFVAAIVLAESLIGISIGTFLTYLFGPIGMLIGLCSAFALMSGAIFPLQVKLRASAHTTLK